MKQLLKSNLDIIIPAVSMLAFGYAALYGIAFFFKYLVDSGLYVL